MPETARTGPDSPWRPAASDHCANQTSATARDFHSFAQRTYKYSLDYMLDRYIQPMPTGFPHFECQFSNAVVEIYARTAAATAELATQSRVRATGYGWVSRAYSLRLARRARYSRASFASRRRSLASNIAFLTMRHAARGRK